MVGLLVGLLLVVVLVGLKRIDTGVQRGKGDEYLGVGTGIGRGHLFGAGVCWCVVALLCAPAQIGAGVLLCCCVVVCTSTNINRGREILW